MWEDQGENILESILNMEKHLITTKENQDLLNESVDAINSDPAVQLRNAMSDLLIASEPVLTTIAEIISKVAEWIQENPKLAATITGIVTGLGILMGIIMGLTPIITAISVAATAMGVSIGAIAGPVMIVIGVIGALIAIGVALYKNWETVKAKASELKEQVVNRFTELKDRASNAIQTFKSNVVNKVNELKSEFVNKANGIKDGAVRKFNELRDRAGQVMSQAKEKILKPIRDAKEKIGGIVDEIKGFFSNMKLKIPKISLPKLPKFKISGDFGLNPPRVPKISVDWRAKGAIFTQPTIFGMNNGRLQGAGEAGPEAALPLNEETLGAIGRGISATMDINQSNRPIVLQIDGKTFAQIIGDYTDEEGGIRIRRVDRGLA